MLRSARSLPTLRALYQQTVKQEASTTVASTANNVSSSSTRYYSTQPIKTNVFQSVDDQFILNTSSKTNRFVNIFKRNVHSTTKKQTVLLDFNSSSKAKYASMNLQGLKLECKKRGLRVSGKKIELVQRLSQQDTSSPNSLSDSRSISTSAKTEAPAIKLKKTSKKLAKNRSPVVQEVTKIVKQQERSISSTPTPQKKADNSSIDFYKIPQNSYPEPDGIPPMKIPSLSTKASLKDKPVVIPSPVGKVEVAEESESTISRAGEIIATSEQPGESSNESNKAGVNESIFFGVFGLLTIGWWSMKSKDGRN